MRRNSSSKTQLPLISISFALALTQPAHLVLAEDFSPNECLKDSEQFVSIALSKDAPPVMKDEKGKYLSETRSILASPPSGDCKPGDWVSVAISSYCKSEQKNLKKIFIPRGRLAVYDCERIEVAVEISKQDYEWLVAHSLLDPKKGHGDTIAYYAECLKEE